MGPDDGYDTCLVFGWRWEVPTPAPVRLLMHQIGMHPRGFTVVGPYDITDELATLELGVHVEMEMVMQEMAAAGEHWADLGAYLVELLEAEVYE